MKRETKVVIGASIAAVGLLLIPMLVAKVRSDREAELMARKPNGATLKFREAIRGVTHINVFRIIEAGKPGTRIPPIRKPVFVLSGAKAARLVRALHFKNDMWEPIVDIPSTRSTCTALEFCSDEKKLADLRVGIWGEKDRGARWYAPPKYIGDSFVLTESRDYLDRQIN
ncbi:hypothetical protein EON83_15870 [bacterium]|nr:MAG: hypothetical protein EON83_15870 [bacterium]